MPRLKSNRKKPVQKQKKPPVLFPVENWLYSDIFSFGHVRGISKVFLIVEMVCVTFVVLGSLLIALLTMLA